MIAHLECQSSAPRKSVSVGFAARFEACAEGRVWVDGRNSHDFVERQILIALPTKFLNGGNQTQTVR